MRPLRAPARVPTLAQRRLAAQHVTRPALASPRAVVEHLGAVQAQDYAASLWAIGLRTRRARVEDVERAVQRGEILRTWPMRRTIHFVPARDARWLVRLLATRQLKASARRLAELGAGASDVTKSRRALARALAGGPLARRDAYAAMERAGVATSHGRGLHLVNHLAQEGLVCLGPAGRGEATIALLDEWAPQGDRGVARGGLADLAARYVASHGPASVADFAWWTGTGKREAASAIAAAKGLREEDGLWSGARARSAASRSPAAHLLPAFDETAVAYKDRSAALARVPPGHANPQVGLLSPSVVVDGQMVGTWGRALRADRVRIALKPLVAWTSAEREAIERAADAFARFLGREGEIEVRHAASGRSTRAPPAAHAASKPSRRKPS